MSDLIDRQDAIDRIQGTGYAEQIKNNLLFILRTLPSAQPKPGEWEMYKDGDGLYGICSVCGCDADFSHYGKAYSYCPNCGAKMEGSES